MKYKIGMVAVMLAGALLVAGCNNSKIDYISMESAKKTALDAAGLTEKQVDFSQADLEDKNGIRYYKIAFAYQGEPYEYDIDAITGVVIESHTPGSQAVADNAIQNDTQAGTPVSIEQAKEIALAHAGLSESQVTFVKSGEDWDDGIQTYDLEFYTQDEHEYDYKIDPYTGNILEHDYDAEYYASSQEKSPGGSHISTEEAKELVLSQVPGATADDIREFETDYENGRMEYEGKILYDHIEYEFEVDGYSGSIRSWTSESIYD